MATENFTTFDTTADPNSRFTITSSKIESRGLTDGEDAWWADDKGASHFGATFTHYFTVTLKSTTSNWIRIGAWAVSNVVDDCEFWAQNDSEAVGVYLIERTNKIQFEDYESDSSDSYTYSGSGPWYCSANRTSETAAELRIYSDAARTTLLDTLLVPVTSGRRFQYVFAAHSNNNGGSDTFDLDIEDLDLNEGDVSSESSSSQSTTSESSQSTSSSESSESSSSESSSSESSSSSASSSSSSSSEVGRDIAGGRAPVYIDSDNLVTLGPLSDLPVSLTATQIQAATGVVTLYNNQDRPVTGASNIAISRVADSDRFYAILPSTVTLREGRSYYALAHIVAGGVTIVLKEQLVGRYQRQRYRG